MTEQLDLGIAPAQTDCPCGRAIDNGPLFRFIDDRPTCEACWSRRDSCKPNWRWHNATSGAMHDHATGETRVAAWMEVKAALEQHRFRYANERELQDGIALVLDKVGRPYRREAVLSPADRPDFLVEPGLAIEVKVAGSATELTQQVHRYVQLPAVNAVLVVTTRMTHMLQLPRILNSKEVHSVHLLGSVL